MNPTQSEKMYNFYPPPYLNYNTMTHPPTFTQYEYTSPKEPNNQAIDAYVKLQKDRLELGRERYNSSRKFERDYDIYAASPVYNSNMNSLRTNYMPYKQYVVVPQGPYSC